MSKQFDMQPFFTPTRKEVSLPDLNQSFAGLSKNLHDLSVAAFGPNGRRHTVQSADPVAQQAALAELAHTCMTNFVDLYEVIPTGHHLQVGITQEQYNDFMRSEHTNKHCFQTNGHDGAMQYWLRVDRKRVNYRDPNPLPVLRVGTSSFEISPIGSDNAENPSIYFDLTENTATSSNRVQTNQIGILYPEHITNLEVVPDKKFALNSFFQ